MIPSSHRTLILLTLILGNQRVEAATPFHLNTFQAGTSEGWTGGASPTVIPTGGPLGANDAFLRITANGMVGPGAHLATYNDEAAWLGDYLGANIRAVTLDFMNPVTSPSLQMRLVLFSPWLDNSRWTSTQAAIVPNDGLWHSYRFYVEQSALTRVQGTGSYNTMITDVTRLMIRHDPGAPSAGGAAVAATLGIDNVRLVPNINCEVFDSLVAAIAAGNHDPSWDLNRDGFVNQDDLTTLRTVGGLVNLASGNPYRPGDANLDGVVDGSDFNIWNSNKFTVAPRWCSGDFNADGVIDGADFNIWNSNKFTSSDSSVVVPEPTSWLLALGIAMSVLTAFRRR